MSAHSIECSEAGVPRVRCAPADLYHGSIIVFKIVQFWTETPAESVYVKLREEI